MKSTTAVKIHAHVMSMMNARMNTMNMNTNITPIMGMHIITNTAVGMNMSTSVIMIPAADMTMNTVIHTVAAAAAVTTTSMTRRTARLS